MTETWAHDLLEHAAATVPVGPPPAFREPRRPRHRWPILAAAATVVLAVGAAGIVGQFGQTPAPTSHRDLRLTQLDVPLTFGMTEQEARTTLESEGFMVTVKHKPTCDETWGRAMSTQWTSPGRVLLTVAAQDPAARCPEGGDPARAIAWQVIDRATGRGPGPPLSSQSRCCSPGLMRRIADAATHFAPTAGAFDVAPQLFVEEPAVRGGPTVINMAIGLRVNGKVWPSVHVQILVGNGLFGPAGQVMALEKSHLKFGSEPTPPDDDGAAAVDPDGVGRRFLDFALGRKASLPVDTPVKLYLGNRYITTIAAPQANDRASWRVCVPYGEGSCPFSALDTLARNGSHPLAWSNDPHQGDFCPDSLAPGPPTDTGGTYAVVLSIPEPQSCAQAFEVQVWTNGVAQIVAVNLLLGSP